MKALALTGLSALASLSPLLTLAALWQVKEWRMDRLREHLRNEGWLRQLFGIVRPAIVASFWLVGFLGFLETMTWVLASLLTLLLTGITQFALRKQPMPVWTPKALALVGTSMILTTGVSFALSSFPSALAFFPLAQSPVLCIAWALWKPCDWFLKRRIMGNAKELRNAHPELTVIGITGSVGKTTTKELLAHLLADRRPLVTPAHVNTEMGVSQWLLHALAPCQMPETTHQILIVEMGAYRRGEIAALCDIVRPTMGVITFIGRQHIALFGSQEALCDAKAELVEALPASGRAFLNVDSPLCEGMRGRARCPVTTVGTGGHANAPAYDVEETPQGIRFRLGETSIALPLRGTHNVANVLLAIAVAEHLGMPRGDIARKLQSFAPPKRTFEVTERNGVTVLDDTHNASPESFKAAIAWARGQPMERKVLLSSGLIELGEAQDRIHAELGAYAASVFDEAIFLHSRAAKSFQEGFQKPVTMFTRDIPPIAPGSLLVCVGRLSPAIISRLVPQAKPVNQ